MTLNVLWKDRAVIVTDDNLKILVISDLHLSDEDDLVHDLIKKAKIVTTSRDIGSIDKAT